MNWIGILLLQLVLLLLVLKELLAAWHRRQRRAIP